MKKPEFVASELEVIRFTESDIIMTSGDDCNNIYYDGPATECHETFE